MKDFMLDKFKRELFIINDFIAICLLIIMGIFVVHNLENNMDVLLWDEARYLDRGFWLWKAFPKTWGPIYSVWYKILSYVESNRIALYYLNYKVLFIASTILTFSFMRAYKASLFVAFFLSSMWLVNTYNLPAWPKISHFSICIILSAGIIVAFLKNTINKTIVFAIAFLICGYARPELYLSFIFILLLLFVLSIKNIRTLNKSNVLYFALLFFLILLSYKAYRTPLNNEDASRGIGVFLQHYAYNYYTWTKQDVIWWFDVQEALDKSFKAPYQLKEIMLNVNSPFWKHILYNTKLFFSHLVFIISNLFFPFAHLNKIPFFIGTCLIGLYVFWCFRQSLPLIIERFKTNWLVFLVLILGILPSIASSIYAHPRTHYLVLLMPLIFLFLSTVFKENIYSSWKVIVAFALFFIFTSPKSKDFKYFDLFGTDKNMMNKKAILFLENKYKTDSVNVFDIDGQLNTLMTQNFRSYNIGAFISKPEYLLSQFIQIEQPNVIYVTPTMFKLKRSEKDTVFQQMILHPESFGYQKNSIPGLTDTYFLISK